METDAALRCEYLEEGLRWIAAGKTGSYGSAASFAAAILDGEGAGGVSAARIRHRRKTYLYVDKNGQVRARYVRLLTLGRFEFALTWIERGGDD